MSEPGFTAPAPEGAANCRPPRDPRIEALAHNSRFWTLLNQDLFGYAGDDPDPRPLPQRTLYSIKKQMSDYLQAGVERQARSGGETAQPWAWDAFQIAFCSERIRMPLDEVIPLPREDLWWIAAPDDLVLLSDRVTHHYTTVDHVAREADRIFFLDEWPDRIFLKAGLNAAGVAAEVHPYLGGVFDGAATPRLGGKKSVSISRAEFVKVAVGLVTLDTPALFDRYLEHRPQARDSYPIRFAFGAALMDVEMNHLARFAAGHFAAARRIAANAQPLDGDAERNAAARLLEALAIADLVQRGVGDALAAKPFAEALRRLLADHDEDELLGRLHVQQLARMGHAAGRAEDFRTGLAYLDRAVARDPEHEGARHLRAMTRSRTEDWSGAAEDIEAALAANARRIRIRTAQRDARDRRDRHGLDDDAARLGGLRTRRIEELGLLATVCGQIGRRPRARAAAEECIALEPELPDGYRMLGVIESQEGRDGEARRHLDAALARERTPQGRAAIERALAILAARATGAPG